MQVPVAIDSENGHCAASVVGVADLRATGQTREQALSDLREKIRERLARGTLVWLDVPERGMIDLFGAFKDDPTVQDICDEAYRARDAERAALGNE